MPSEVIEHKKKLDEKRKQSTEETKQRVRRHRRTMKVNLGAASMRIDRTLKAAVSERRLQKRASSRRKTFRRAKSLIAQQKNVKQIKKNAKKKVDNALHGELAMIMHSEALFMKREAEASKSVRQPLMKHSDHSK